jgi:two-component system cell cycle sensor histidine kinase/response regulator CckA
MDDIATVYERTLAINEALLIGSLRQHELTGTAEKLNAQLRTEIDERKRVEEALRESEERFRTLFTSAPMAVFACGRDGVIQDFNQRAAELWGREPKCGVEQHWDTLKLRRPDGTPLPQDISPMTEVLRIGTPALSVELLMERPDGSHLPILANFAPLKNMEGEITGAITSFLDLTERNQLAEQYRRAQRMESIGTLAGGIAHDLNNALLPIIMSLEVLKMKFSDPASQELLGIIGASAQRGADMVQQVLSFARGVEGRRMEVEIPKLLGDVEKIVTDLFPKNVGVQTVIPRDLWTVVGDPTQLNQVLLNLCLNARDAMPDGGILRMSAKNCLIDSLATGADRDAAAEPGPYMLIQVEDSGMGIPREIIEKIFDPFFTTKEVGSGTGLGLSTSVGIVKSHGGLIRVSSMVGEGTTFRVYLPAQVKPPNVKAAEKAANMPRGNGELVLVVDDEAAVRQITKRTLETFGYRVRLAAEGNEALAIYTLQREEIAVVLTDMTMPGMDGPTLIQALREMDPELRIVGASGFSASSVEAKVAGMGVKHFLPKPYSAGTLLKMFKAILEEK